jgi:hypothetical protein
MSETPKLDIMVEMANADLRNKDFYANLEPDLQKQFSAYPAMRWLSTVSDKSPMKDWYLIMVNNIVNENFWQLGDHPELQWKLMAVAGCGQKQYHAWIPPAKRKKISKISEYFLRWYPSYNDQELAILMSGMDRDGFEQFVKSTGADDAERKELLKVYDAENGTSAPKKASKKRKAD